MNYNYKLINNNYNMCRPSKDREIVQGVMTTSRTFS